ncbi:MAG: DUF1643 domain-containing protein [Candidatus Sulfobium sp.]
MSIVSERKTIFSPCRQYRYTLWRDLTMFPERPGYVQFIGLNPSKADEVRNDNTVTRCINFAKSWGYGLLCMTNVVAAWGNDGQHLGRSSPVMEMLNLNGIIPTCLDITKQGEPIHPLYVPANRKPILYKGMSNGMG